MSSPRWIRWTARALMVAGLVWSVGVAAMVKVLPVVSWERGHWLLGLAGLLSMLGLLGLAAYDGRRTGWLGTAGYVLALLGAIVFSTGNIVEVGLGMELGVRMFGLGLLSLIAGTLLLAFVILRLKLLPSWSMGPLIIGWVAYMPVLPLGYAAFGPEAGASANSVVWITLAYTTAMLLGVGWATLGYALWSSHLPQAGPDVPTVDAAAPPSADDRRART